MTATRHTRYQAAVIRDGHLLLVRCAFRDGRIAWMLPGGGREEDEEEATCVAREVLEECGVTVRVDHLLSDVAADPPDGTYVRWRTYQCSVLGGEPRPGGGEGPNAELVAVQWLPLSPAAWSDDVTTDRWLHPQLVRLCGLVSVDPAAEADLLAYYSARANEYENVYAKPERQADLQELRERIPAYFTDCSVLEIACGTGYWTRLLAARARVITAVDASTEVLTLAHANQPAAHPATFLVADAFALDDVPGSFDAAFAGFWWSHVRLAELSRFLLGLHNRLEPGSPVVVVDNRYVEGSNWPIARMDDDGNTYQRRRLERGTTHEVLKNFPTPDGVRAAIEASGGERPKVHSLEYYWYATYTVAGAV